MKEETHTEILNFILYLYSNDKERDRAISCLDDYRKIQEVEG